jgi:hypothetical protein
MHKSNIKFTTRTSRRFSLGATLCGWDRQAWLGIIAAGPLLQYELPLPPHRATAQGSRSPNVSSFLRCPRNTTMHGVIYIFECCASLIYCRAHGPQPPREILFRPLRADTVVRVHFDLNSLASRPLKTCTSRSSLSYLSGVPL